MSNEPIASTNTPLKVAGSDGKYELAQATLPANIGDRQGLSASKTEQVAVRDLVDAQRILQVLSQNPLISIGVSSQIHAVVSVLISSTPELQERYNLVKDTQTLKEIFLSAATFGFLASPAQRFIAELYGAVSGYLAQLHQQGLIVQSVEGAVPYMPATTRTCCGDGPPIILTTISITDAGRRALEESARAQ